MDVPIAEQAQALHDLARWERHRISLTLSLANQGQAEPVCAVELGGWRERLRRLEAAAAMLTVLIPHEAALEALDPLLRVPPAPPTEPPVLWFRDRTDPLGR